MQKNNTIPKSRFLLPLLLVLPFISQAQESEITSTSTYFSNALFNTLVITVMLLAILIVALSSVLKNISGSDFLIRSLKEKENNNAKTMLTITGLMLLSVSSFAQDTAPVITDDGRVGGIDPFTFYFMVTLIFLELVVAGVLIYTIKFILKPVKNEEPVTVSKPKIISILSKLNDAVEIEKEESILLDHDYDGIRELDNNLPPWWKYGFYLTIVVAVIYLVNYHVIKTSPLQAEEYKISMDKAAVEVAEFMKNSANNVDESTVKLLVDPSDLATGKELFSANCVACHGKGGEGTVGPNLTDDYWLHSGGVRDIFKTIKYGWPDKGMKSWKEDFSPMQIAQLASYIKSLHGSNPPMPKEKQGELYAEETALANDSLVIKKDTLQSSLPVDSLKK